MTWDIASAKSFLGLPAAVDPVLDPRLQVGLDTALSIAEAYCDRKFMHTAAQVETFTHTSGGSISLIRYPLDKDPVLSGDQNTYKFHTDWQNGVVHFDSTIADHQMTATYSGGYTVLPSDLEFALWSVFGSVWSNMQSGATGAAAGGIKKVSIVGVGSVDFDSSSGGSGGGSGGYSPGSLIPTASAFILDTYRRVLA